MTKTEILQLVLDISGNKADPVTISTYFDQLLDDLGRHNPEMTSVENVAVIGDTSVYTMPETCILEQGLIFDDRQLMKTEIGHLEALSPEWRSHRGKPFAYIKEEQTARNIRLYPIPKESSTPSLYSPGDPLALDFPEGSLTWIFSSRRNDNIPMHLVLGIVFQILSWEFMRPCKHQSVSYSQVCQKLASLFFTMTGIPWQVAQPKQG